MAWSFLRRLAPAVFAATCSLAPELWGCGGDDDDGGEKPAGDGRGNEAGRRADDGGIAGSGDSGVIGSSPRAGRSGAGGQGGAAGTALVGDAGGDPMRGADDPMEWANWPVPTDPALGLPHPAAYDVENGPGPEAEVIVKDRVTGLSWLAESRSLTIMATPDPLENRYEKWVELCDGMTAGGESDWRLPTRSELASLLRNDQYESIDSEAFTGGGLYWTTTPYPLEPASMSARETQFAVDFSPTASVSSIEVNKTYVFGMCVRSDAAPPSGNHYEVSAEYVYDPRTDLTWKRQVAAPNDLEKLYWDEAQEACTDLGDGWRLPAAKELLTILTPMISPEFKRNDVAPFRPVTRGGTIEAFWTGDKPDSTGDDRNYYEVDEIGRLGVETLSTRNYALCVYSGSP